MRSCVGKDNLGVFETIINSPVYLWKFDVVYTGTANLRHKQLIADSSLLMAILNINPFGNISQYKLQTDELIRYGIDDINKDFEIEAEGCDDKEIDVKKTLRVLIDNRSQGVMARVYNLHDL